MGCSEGPGVSLGLGAPACWPFRELDLLPDMEEEGGATVMRMDWKVAERHLLASREWKKGVRRSVSVVVDRDAVSADFSITISRRK